MSTDQTAPSQERRSARRDQIRRPRLRGEERDRMREKLAKAYDEDASIRGLADEHDLSFGLTRTLLLEADVELRSRQRKAAEQ
jgi:hypothetical protein